MKKNCQFWDLIRYRWNRIRWKLSDEKSFYVSPTILKFSKFLKFWPFWKFYMAIVAELPKILTIFFVIFEKKTNFELIFKIYDKNNPIWNFSNFWTNGNFFLIFVQSNVSYLLVEFEVVRMSSHLSTKNGRRAAHGLNWKKCEFWSVIRF